MNRSPIPVEYEQISNGLHVVVSPNYSAPVASVGVYYKIGSRLEPKGRSGFAHLFEHLMFQGSANVAKMQHVKLVNCSGGRPNGQTGYDLTAYYQAVPSNALERVLWLEADRMRSLKVDSKNLENQREVVKEEVRDSVLNQPYGTFPWLDIANVAFRNWANMHNSYGDFADLDAANLDDVRNFFKTYYVPNNALLLMLGDVDPEEGLAFSKQYFGDIPPGSEILFQDTSEPEQTGERRGYVEERLGTLSAVAIGYMMPKRRTRDWYAMALLDQALHNGRAGRIQRELVQERQIAVQAGGGIDNVFGYNGPTQMKTHFMFSPEHSSESALAAFDSVVGELQESGISQNELEQLRVKWRSAFYDNLDSGGRVLPRSGLMHLLACFTLFDDAPQSVNTILDGFLAVSREEILSVARRYLRKENRSIVFRIPTSLYAQEACSNELRLDQ